jgi:hypothetical protein
MCMISIIGATQFPVPKDLSEYGYREFESSVYVRVLVLCIYDICDRPVLVGRTALRVQISVELLIRDWKCLIYESQRNLISV